MREPDDYIPLKYYFSFNLGLKETQEHKYWKGKQQGMIEKQRNTTRYRGACINTRKSSDI